MSQLVNYSIIEAGLRALADKAHESAVAQAEGKPIPCGLSEGDMELVALLTAMMNDTQANKGWCAQKWAYPFLKLIEIMERKYRQPLNAYDYQPEEMKAYLRHNGWHFNKKMCEWAVKQMRKNGKPIRMMSKDDIEDILKKNNIVLENNVGYDACYIAHICLADFYGSSITEEKQMAQFIKDYVDDEDQQDGFIFNRFYADTSFNGVGIPWEDIL